MPRKEIDKEKLKQLAARSYTNSVDKFIDENEDYVNEQLELFIVQMYTIAKTLDEKNANNAQTSGTLTQEWRQTCKEAIAVAQKEKDRQEAEKLAAELESKVDPEEEALGDFIS